MTTQEQIINRAKELGFIEDSKNLYKKDLPYGLKNYITILINHEDTLWCIGNHVYTVVVKEVESLEDFELLYNAILPEKYRLPFD